MSRRAALYLRQSQALGDDEAAVTRQELACRSLAELRDLDIIAVYRDNDVSATSSKLRPDYSRMLADYETGTFSAIIAWDLDRLYRKPRDLEDLIDLAEKRGLGLYTASGEADLATDGGRLFARIKAAVAKGEIERKSARQKLRREQDQAAGKPYWRRRPFGYELDGTHRADEAEAIRQAYRDIAAGDSVAQVVRRWNAAGLRTPMTKAGLGGELMSGPAVRKILERPGTAGFLKLESGELMRGAWEPIVDELTWRRHLSGRRRRTGSASPTPGRATQLLSGIAWCGVCPPGTSVMWTNRATRGHLTYRCSKASHLVRKVEICDAFVEGWIWARLSRPDAVDLVTPKHAEIDFEAIRSEREAIRARMVELARDHYELDLISREVFVKVQRTLQARLTELEASMEVKGLDPSLGALIGAADVAEMWAQLSLERRRRVVGGLLEVTILGGRGVAPELKPRDEV